MAGFFAIAYTRRQEVKKRCSYRRSERGDLQKEIDARISQEGFRAYYVLEMKNIGVLYSYEDIELR